MDNEKINQWVSEMTVEEKASLCSGADTWNLKTVPRLKTPGAFLSDGPHGLRKQVNESDNLGLYNSIQAVCFPAACAGASSFDTALMNRLGDLLGKECRAENVGILLGPAVNIKRSPLCGRNFEYFSEDPYLAGKMAAAYIKGVQENQVGTSIKHFAVNNQETMRQTVSAQLSERALHETYLTPFETAVKEAKPWTVMCSYNRINGVYASENKKLLTDILRGQWGFEGFVVSDWGAVNERVPGLKAGLDLEMPSSGGVNDKKIADAVTNGSLDEAVLDEAVRRILTVADKAAHGEAPVSSFDLAKDHCAAVEMESECAVLLKNGGALPLPKTANVVYIGEFAENPRYQGGGSSHINAYKVESALESARVDGLSVAYCQGWSEEDNGLNQRLLEEAVAAAGEADYAVIFAGLPDSFESEGYDREHMDMPDYQNALIEAVAAVQKKTVVVLHNGSPVEMPWVGGVNAVLELYLGGEGVGKAAHQLLYGMKNPSGRLAETFPLKLEDNPSYLNFPGENREVRYAEDIFVGYKYYQKKKMDVLFPFGHGLSYTRFAYQNLKVSGGDLTKKNPVTVSVEIQNVGTVPGKEVVQLYISDLTASASRPVKELKGFAKTAVLEPGQSETVRFELDFRSLAWYCEELADWYAAPGQYSVLIGSTSHDIRLETEITYETDEKLPFPVDKHTTVAELLEDSRTEAYMRAVLKRLAGILNSTGLSSAPAEVVKKMAANLPLATIQNFIGMPDEEFEEMLGQFQTLLSKEK